MSGLVTIETAVPLDPGLDTVGAPEIDTDRLAELYRAGVPHAAGEPRRRRRKGPKLERDFYTVATLDDLDKLEVEFARLAVLPSTPRRQSVSLQADLVASAPLSQGYFPPSMLIRGGAGRPAAARTVAP